MAKYGLSAKVYQTYVGDFHGRSASLYAGQEKAAEKVIAVCTDCHGFHEITRNGTPAGSGVLKANLQKTCARCHRELPRLSGGVAVRTTSRARRRRPSCGRRRSSTDPDPLMIGGLVLQILLHLWRVVVNK